MRTFQVYQNSLMLTSIVLVELVETQKLGIILDHAINDNDTNKSKNCRPQAVVLLSSEPRAERQKVKLCKFMTKKKKKKRRDLDVERKFPLICPLANAENKANHASVFVGRVFFILIRNLELQRGVSEKGLDLQTHSANALFKRTLQRSTN